MRIFVVSNPDAIENEAGTVNALFLEGLELFHLRKPHYSEKELIELIGKIDLNYHSKIVLHQQHNLAAAFEINRIHFPESERLKVSEADLEKHKTNGFIISTSVHLLNDYELLSKHFNYTFFGPVFESISKVGYKPQSDEMVRFEKNEDREIKIIAIGGINPGKIEMLKEANFDGIALLGAIWNNPKNAINIFKTCCRNVTM